MDDTVSVVFHSDSLKARDLFFKAVCKETAHRRRLQAVRVPRGNDRPSHEDGWQLCEGKRLGGGGYRMDALMCQKRCATVPSFQRSRCISVTHDA